MGEQNKDCNAGSIDSITCELGQYFGLDRTIGLCLPGELVANAQQGLDLLRTGAARHYTDLERHVRVVGLSERPNNYASVSTGSIHLTVSTLQKGRVYCAVMSVHEAKHLELEAEQVMPWEQEETCLEAEAGCIEALGEMAWKEMRMGFPYSRGAYLGLRRLNRSM